MNDGKIKKFEGMVNCQSSQWAACNGGDADEHSAEVKSETDLLGPGAVPGTVPTDLEQATGLERLEILGKMQGVDIFDMKPLDASRKGRHRIRR